MKYAGIYFEHILTLLRGTIEREGEHIDQCAEKIFETTCAGKRTYFFGCTHAGILAQEAFYRTGGLAVINPILPPGLTCDVTPITLTSALERVDGLGKRISDAVGFESGDLLFVHSVSGRNAVPVELAACAKERGAYVVALTNLAYSEASSPRGTLGKRLFEVADLVLDNGGCFGDADVEIEGFPQKVAPTSTVVGAAIVNAIVAETAARFVERGMNPPVFMSANIDGGDQYNDEVLKKYAGQITYMGSSRK